MSNIYIYGTGNNAKKIVNAGVKGDIIGYLESKPKSNYYAGKKVYIINEVSNYDAIIVASIYTDEIYHVLRDNDVDMQKVVFMFHGINIDDKCNVELAKKVLSVANYTLFLSSHKMYEKSFFAEDKQLYSQLNTRENFRINENDIYPIIIDKYSEMGSIDDYFWQDLWAAKLIHKNKPCMHYDIGSRLDGFIAHILAMDIPLRVIDVRPFPLEIENMETVVDDATELRQFDNNSVDSMSALCSLEHFGLGRYGDKVDPEACFKVFDRIQDKLKIGGSLYVSVPIGKEKVQFNAHRIFYASTIVEMFSRMELKELSCCVGGEFKKDIDIHQFDNYEDDRLAYGLFYFKKK